MRKEWSKRKKIISVVLAMFILSLGGGGIWLYRQLTFVPECGKGGFSSITINRTSPTLHDLFGIQPPGRCRPLQEYKE